MKTIQTQKQEKGKTSLIQPQNQEKGKTSLIQTQNQEEKQSVVNQTVIGGFGGNHFNATAGKSYS